MAFIKCSGGGKLKETVLWSNPDITVSFAQQTVTLNNDINNYVYLKFIFYAGSGGNPTETIITVKEFKEMTNTGSGNRYGRVCSPEYIYNNYRYIRGFYYISNLSIYFNHAYPLATNAVTYKDNLLLPYQIIGLKY